MKAILSKIFDKMGYLIREKIEFDSIISRDNEFQELYEKCKPYTMTSVERMYALYNSVIYIIKNNIEGDFIECGVWKGGSTMMIAYILKKYNINDRKIFLYDTFEGMVEPTDKDINLTSSMNTYKYWKNKNKNDFNEWCYSSIEEVKINMEKTRYFTENIFYVKGKVENTLPLNKHSNISLLRLDTDWYESTKSELNHLFPKLSKNGVLIIDDYGTWGGCKLAVDEYFKNDIFLFNRIDNTSRLILKNKL